MKNQPIDPQLYALYDEYCHSAMSRREFLNKAAKLTIAGGSAIVMAQALLPNYAHGHTISFTDSRIKPSYVEYPSVGGNSGKMRGYLVAPAGEGPFPAVLVIHENRGLNPYIEDVARALAVEGFLALAPDGLYPAGGYPGNDDDGKIMQRALDQDKLFKDMLNSAYFLKNHALSTGKLGATGFCFGGAVVNRLATDMGADLLAGVPYYGRAAKTEDVANIQAELMIQYAEQDPRVNAMRAEYEQALTQHKKKFVMHVYPDTQHGFHNFSTPRHNQTQADIAWLRTISFFKRTLAK